MPHLLLPFLAAVYAVFLLAAAAALLLRRPGKTPSGGDPPAITVVVPARDEETTLGRCLASLDAQTYPRDRLQVVVVDDGSTDGTPGVLAAWAARSRQVTPVRLERDAHTLPGKTGALVAGIAAARGGLLLFTDADCTVPPTWAATMAGAYAAPSVELVAGFTVLDGGRLFERVQAIDWLFLFSLAAAGTAGGFPLTAVGNNLSVRRDTYDALGGYPALPFSVTEDFRLFQAVTARSRHAGLFLMDAACAVHSSPCATWAELIRQKKRWFLGGTGMSPIRIAVFLLLFLFHALLVVSLFTSPPAALAAFGVKILCDALLLLPAVHAFGRRRLLVLLPLFEIYLTAYVLLVPLLVALRPSVVWKGRKVRNDRAPRRTSGGLGN